VHRQQLRRSSPLFASASVPRMSKPSGPNHRMENRCLPGKAYSLRIKVPCYGRKPMVHFAWTPSVLRHSGQWSFKGHPHRETIWIFSKRAKAIRLPPYVYLLTGNHVHHFDRDDAC
jgi:hypothetical protein